MERKPIGRRRDGTDSRDNARQNDSAGSPRHLTQGRSIDPVIQCLAAAEFPDRWPESGSEAGMVCDRPPNSVSTRRPVIARARGLTVNTPSNRPGAPAARNARGSAPESVTEIRTQGSQPV